MTRWEEMHFLPGVTEAISLLNQNNFRVIVVSNQRCVAKGLLTIRHLESIHQQMCERLAAAGAIIDGVYYCPHDKWPACHCRKPAPGMLLEAAREHGIDLAVSWMVGDSEIDVEAGKNAGCKTVRLVEKTEIPEGKADMLASSLEEAIQQILRMEKARGFVGGIALDDPPLNVWKAKTLW